VLSDFLHLVDLAAERTGGRVLHANDEFFAEKENLLKTAEPVFIEDKYTDRGKWMDGWETRRRRTPGHDWCLIRLGLPGILRGVMVDTSFFRGNFPSHCSIDATSAQPDATSEQLLDSGTRWNEVLPKTELQGDTQNLFAIDNPCRFTHLRLNVFPDGGVARLRVHGDVVPEPSAFGSSSQEIDLVAIEHGGRVLGCSDKFFSHPHNLLMPGRGARMDDGWETKRRRGPGHDWVLLELGVAGDVRRVEVDTAHFKGNFPESCSLLVCASQPGTAPPEDFTWQELLPRTKLSADSVHVFEKELRAAGPITHVRFNIFPDGGVSRLRLFGSPSREGLAAAALRYVNALPPEEAMKTLRDCCGSTRWAEQIANARPFDSSAALLARLQEFAAALERSDWLEAFDSHPRIGEKKSAVQSAQANRWSAAEQSAVHNSQGEAAERLAAACREYEQRFEHIFIVCAAGRSADEILAALRARLKNDPAAEFAVACDEQKKIARLRLERLVQP
jgi:allantoicase